jgi:carbonic anhydrase/acetyltransferase-like protein (isoleucine patch superfamily)
VVGNVTIGKDSSVWFNCVIRGDVAPITIGEGTNIQDLTILHVGAGHPLHIGNQVTMGNRCIVHGCTIEDNCMIGMGAIVMNGAKIGHGSIVAAGSVVLENATFAPFSLLTGVPARLKKTFEGIIGDRIRVPAENYIHHAAVYRSSRSLTLIK